MEDRQNVPILVDIIRQSIKDCIDGSATIEQTKNAYRVLLSKYRTLERRLISPRSQGYLKGLLYHHNLANYCKITAVMKKEGDTYHEAGAVGDRILLAAVPGLLNDLLDRLVPDESVTRNVSWSGSRKYYLAARLMRFHGSECVFTALTSSPIFRIEVFDRFHSLIRDIFAGCEAMSTPIARYTHSARLHSLMSLLQSPTSGSLMVCIHNYDVLGKIFMPMGMVHLDNAVGLITGAIRDRYPSDSHLVSLSYYRHIVVFDGLRDSNPDLAKPLMLTFSGTPIPSRIEAYDLGNETARANCVRSLFR